jgi:hypothetical protein
MLPDLQLSDIVRLRKPHPCGSYEWKVVRLGADIGIECMGCSRRVILPRRQLARRVKSFVHPVEQDILAESKQPPGSDLPGSTQAEGLAKQSDDPSSF